MLKRIITVELEYNPEVDKSEKAFREYPAIDALAWGRIVYDEIEGEDESNALPKV